MPITIDLPTAVGAVERLEIPSGYQYEYRDTGRFASRTLLAAPHVVPDLRWPYTPGVDGRLDLETTVAFRRFLWDLGFGVADAMSTAERGPGGLSWPQVRELLEASKAAAREGDLLMGGVGTDQYGPGELTTLEAVADAFIEQLDVVEGLGIVPILRGSHHLAALAQTAADYALVYDRVLEAASVPLVVHWSGAIFQPQFASYWGSTQLREAIDHFVAILDRHPGKVVGVKFSVMDAAKERELRDRLPEGCVMYTGDDYHYADLIVPDDPGEEPSQALLGILAGIAPIASAAMRRLDAGHTDAARDMLRRSETLSRKVFEAPANRYPAGIAFLAYLDDRQSHPRLLSGREGARSIVHYAEVFRLAIDAGLLRDARLAVDRFRPLLDAAGVDQAEPTIFDLNSPKGSTNSE